MPEILVEFVPDFSKLETGVEQLVSNKTISKEMAALFNDAGKTIDQFGAKFAKLGGGNTLKPAIDAAKKSIKDLSTSGIKDLGELKKRVDGITTSFTEGFGEGVEQALKEAGISLDQFNKAVKQTADADKTLKSELREINEEMARLKLNGQDNTEQYDQLSQKAGQYRDALQDVNEEINRQASDTGKLDVAIRFVTGLASAYSVLQGIQALAGKDNEELQKTLLKVNAAMSILNGLQAIQAELKRKDNILTIAQTGLQKLYAFAVGTSTGAMKAFRVALAATGVGLLLIGITALISKLLLFSDTTEDAVDEIKNLTLALDQQNQALDDNNRKLDTANKLRILKLKEVGATEKEINAQTIIGLNEQAKASENLADRQVFQIKKILDLYALQVTNAKTAQDAINFFRARGADEEVALVEKALKNFKDAEEKRTQIVLFGAEQRAAQAQDARDKQKDLDDKNAQDQLKRDAENRRKLLDDDLAFQKSRLLVAKQGSIEELDARKEVLKSELAIAFDNDKLTFNQKKLLLQQFFKDQRELTEQFNADNNKRILDDQASLVAAQLAQLNLSFDERERLLVEQLEIERQIQLSAVINNKTKEKEINAKFDKEIIEQRKKIREDAFAEELAQQDRENFQRKKQAEDAANEDPFADDSKQTNEQRKKSFEIRKQALTELGDLELQKFTERRLFNQSQLKAGLIDEKEFSKTALDISNEEFEAKSKLQKDYTALVKEESDKRKEKFKADLDIIIGVANQLSQAFSSFQDVMNANEDARIEAQKKHLQILREGNAITEKEFVERMKKIDKIEREGKQKQAEREKALALFEATVNGASAIIKSLGESPFVIAATIALVTAQIAAIAARPIPKFGKGTDKAPKGLAQVGETGTELIQTDKGYYLAEHPQIVWFKGGEVVYNPSETKDILTPQANMTVINNTNGVSHENKIDYDKMAKKFGDEIAKHPRLIASFDEDGFSVHLSQKLNNTKYLNKRFTFND